MVAQLHNITNTPENIKDEWRTPPEVFNWARKLVGGIDYDTACTNENALAKPINEHRFNNDALASLWFGKCWCNPPFSSVDAWVGRAIESKNAITAMPIPSCNGEDRYAKLMQHAHEIAIIGRLSFIAPFDYVIKGKNGKPDKHIKAGQAVSGFTRGCSLFIINGYGQGSRSFVERDWIMENFK